MFLAAKSRCMMRFDAIYSIPKIWNLINKILLITFRNLPQNRENLLIRQFFREFRFHIAQQITIAQLHHQTQSMLDFAPSQQAYNVFMIAQSFHKIELFFQQFSFVVSIVRGNLDSYYTVMKFRCFNCFYNRRKWCLTVKKSSKDDCWEE